MHVFSHFFLLSRLYVNYNESALGLETLVESFQIQRIFACLSTDEGPLSYPVYEWRALPM